MLNKKSFKMEIGPVSRWWHVLIAFLVFTCSIEWLDASFRVKRNVVEMGEMIQTAAPKIKNPEELTSYGNYCGFGGSGDPIDPIDSCCQAHDHCYDRARLGACTKEGLASTAIYLHAYNWKYDARSHQVVCQKGPFGHPDVHGHGEIRIAESTAPDMPTEGVACDQSVCVCDAIFTTCLNANAKFMEKQNVNPSITHKIARYFKGIFG